MKPRLAALGQFTVSPPMRHKKYILAGKLDWDCDTDNTSSFIFMLGETL